MRAIGRRMLQRGLSKALNQWVEMAYERARSIRLLKRVVARVSRRVLVRTFEAWAEVAHADVEAREASSRARVRANEMAEIETTYQVIKYEVGTSVDVGARATEDGWMGGWMRGETSGERMMLGWMKTTRGGRTRGWRD